MNSESLSSEEKSVFFSPSADINDFFEKLDKKSLTKLSQELKDKIVAQIDIEKLFEKSESSDLSLMERNPILCGYIRMDYETYVKNRSI